VTRTPAEILAIHPGALGDVLQAVPALRALRALDGESRVTLAAQPRIGHVLLDTRVVDGAVSFDGLRLEHLFSGDAAPDGLRSRLARFDRVVSWFGSRADGYAERLRALARDSLVAPPTPDDAGELPVWEHLVATLRPWGATSPSPAEPLEIPDAWRAEAAEALRRLGLDVRRRLLTIHPGAGGTAKRWPVAKLAAVIRSVAGPEDPVLVHQGPADEAAARELLLALADRAAPVPVRLLLEPSLRLLAGVLRASSAYLGADSGVSHLAAATGTPAVIMFLPEARRPWAPWSPTARPLTMTTGAEDTRAAAAALADLIPGR
jgi:ADP-heptose:LPS heptosyltransferase